MARKKRTKTQPADQGPALEDSTTKAPAAAEPLRPEAKAAEDLSLSEGEWTAIGGLATLPARIKKKLAKPDADFTVAEVARITAAVVAAFPGAEPGEQPGLLLVARKLLDCLQNNAARPGAAALRKTDSPADTAYQLKITLVGSRPPVWRRIQVKDCTLDKLHEHIQTAMGWTNSHLHHFRINNQLYGDPELMQENFEEMGYEDSTTTMLSDILPKTGKRFRFGYEYDFGDSWEHEILFEGRVRAEPGRQYPLCLEGERACPPEDVGGIWGYTDFVEAIQDPDHERHEQLLEWAGGEFDPEGFDPAAATKAMKKGLPDWRRMQ